MDKVVAYLLEKETITGGEMVAIIEGRDPEQVENPYASTRPAEIEAPAKKVHMISEKILSPEETEEAGETPSEVSPEPSPEAGPEISGPPEETGETT